MKVILLEDVYKQGVAGDMVDVAPGYARNYLIPQGLAVKATPGALKQLENLRKQTEMRRAEREKRFEEIAERIEELKLYFGVRAGDTGRLYGSVTTADIASALKDEIGLEIDPRRVGNRALRELGIFEVPVRLDTGLVPDITVIVHREEEDPRAAEADLREAEAAAEAAEAEEEAYEEYAAAEVEEGVEEEELETAEEE